MRRAHKANGFDRHEFLDRRIRLVQATPRESRLTPHKSVDNLIPTVENVAFTCLLLHSNPYLRRDRGRAMQSKLKMRHFEAVIALAEEMHYGRAAERVGLTQSGLSRCIQSAEREAKATLFERNRAGMELTDAGRTYVEHARTSLLPQDVSQILGSGTRNGLRPYTELMRWSAA
jgi:predicted DNA-binding protein (UPF0251 family)